MEEKIRKKLLKIQRDEVTDASVYIKILQWVKNPQNKRIINQIASMEEYHASVWEKYTKKKVKPYKYKVWLYTIAIKYLGITFGLKLMEKGERDSILNYKELSEIIPEAKEIQKDEEQHENQLIELIDDESLNYLGSVVLGLNDALVELTGVLAGLTFGLQNSKMIAFVGIITGISAAFSMAGSEYLSTKTDNINNIKPTTASIYTGIAYIITVILLISPYLIFSNIYIALTLCILTAISIIAIFNYYTAIAKDYSFKSRFLEMTCISLSVAFISFIIGIIVKAVFKIEV